MELAQHDVAQVVDVRRARTTIAMSNAPLVMARYDEAGNGEQGSRASCQSAWRTLSRMRAVTPKPARAGSMVAVNP